MPLKKIIVCVCRGNILRSPVAEKLIGLHLTRRGLDKHYQVISRSIQGTWVDTKLVRYPNLTYYSPIYQQLKSTLDKLKIDLSKHRSTPINHYFAKKATVLLAIDRQTKSALATLYPRHVEKVFLFSDLVDQGNDITDVVYEARQTYRVKAVKEICDILDKGFDNILKLVEG